RSEAIELVARPGQLLYWPRDWWHISEGSPEGVLTLALGVIRSHNPFQRASIAFQRLHERGAILSSTAKTAPTADAFERAAVEDARHLLDDDSFADELTATALKYHSSCGFPMLPPI